MGFGIKELIVILIIVALLFGTKRLKNMGSDLGGAIKGFKKSMNDESCDDKPEELEQPAPLEPSESKQKEESKPE